MIKVYGSEDTIFRLAAFIKAKADGMTTSRPASSRRTRSSTTASMRRGFTALRKTALPFIAFSYRAIPKLYDTAKNKPWKLMSLFIAMQALNMLTTAAVAATRTRSANCCRGEARQRLGVTARWACRR